MSENTKSAFDVITSGTVSPDTCLTSVFEIDDILSRIKELNDKITHLKGLKRYRAESADVEIKSLEEKVVQFRELIKTTMLALKPEEKTLHFPPLGKVSRREEKESWDIVDEDSFLKFLEEKNSKELVVKTKEVIDRRAAKKLIAQYVAEGLEVPGVKEIPASVSLSITFEDVPKISSTTIKKPKLENKEPKIAPKSCSLGELGSLEV